MRPATSIANKLLSLAQAKTNTLTPMQLMKLVYLSHGWMLGIHGRQLVKEPIEAWLYGPVIRDLYRLVKDFKSSAVAYPLRESEQCTLDTKEEALINEVYDKYGMFSGPVLSALTHSPNSPWHITWTKYGKNSVISNDLIEDYYRKLSKPAIPHLVQ